MLCFKFKIVLKNLEAVSNNFDFLLPQNVVNYSETDLIKSSYDFITFYQSDVTSDLIRQILSLKEFLGKTKMKTINELCSYLIKNDFSSLFSEIVTAFLR